MSDWTLGAVKARNMEILALCEQEGCRHMFVFNLDALIEGVGPDYKVADIPPHDLPPMRRRPAGHSAVLRRPAARGRGGVVSSLSTSPMRGGPVVAFATLGWGRGLAPPGSLRSPPSPSRGGMKESASLDALPLRCLSACQNFSPR